MNAGNYLSCVFFYNYIMFADKKMKIIINTLLLQSLCMSIIVQTGCNSFVLPAPQVNPLIMCPGGYKTSDYGKYDHSKPAKVLFVYVMNSTFNKRK